MLLVPFGFIANGIPRPSNTVAPLLVVFDEENRIISYTAGTWEGADSVSFAWYMNNELQVGEVGTQFTAEYDLDVKVIETAVNVRGETTAESNIINFPSPPQHETGSITWDFVGNSMDSLLDTPVEDTGSVNWVYEGDILDSYIVPVDLGEISWEVFGGIA